MANRFSTTNARTLAYRFIAQRDGEQCLRCWGEHHIYRKPPRVNLDIDHADGNPRNNDPANLHLLCNPCNNEMRRFAPSEHKKLMERYCAERARERGRDFEAAGGQTELNQQIVGYDCASPEMKVNGLCEVKYREFVFQEIRVHGHIAKPDAINGGAERVGCNPLTTQRYLAKLVSRYGPLAEVPDPYGQKIIVFRVEPPGPAAQDQGKKNVKE